MQSDKLFIIYFSGIWEAKFAGIFFKPRMGTNGHKAKV